MSKMKFLCLYESYEPVFRTMPPAQVGKVILGMYDYIYHGLNPEFKGRELTAFLMLRSQLDRDKERYDKTCERNRVNGARGGKARSAALAFDRKQEQADAGERLQTLKNEAKEKEKENDKDKDNDKEIENKKENEKEKENESESEKEKEKEKETAAPLSAAVPRGQHLNLPELGDVQKYCLEQGLTCVDPERFYDYYQARGWQMGNYAMQDWKAALRSWNREDSEKLMKEDYNEFDFLDR